VLSLFDWSFGKLSLAFFSLRLLPVDNGATVGRLRISSFLWLPLLCRPFLILSHFKQQGFDVGIRNALGKVSGCSRDLLRREIGHREPCTRLYNGRSLTTHRDDALTMGNPTVHGGFHIAADTPLPTGQAFGCRRSPKLALGHWQPQQRGAPRSSTVHIDDGADVRFAVNTWPPNPLTDEQYRQIMAARLRSRVAFWGVAEGSPRYRGGDERGDIRNQESGHERTETLPCMKRSPTNGSTNESGRRAELGRRRPIAGDLGTATVTTSYKRDLMRRLRGKRPNHSSAHARAPRPV
jgi:hypothetical protein